MPNLTPLKGLSYLFSFMSANMGRRSELELTQNNGECPRSNMFSPYVTKKTRGKINTMVKYFKTGLQTREFLWKLSEPRIRTGGPGKSEDLVLRTKTSKHLYYLRKHLRRSITPRLYQWTRIKFVNGFLECTEKSSF